MGRFYSSVPVDTSAPQERRLIALLPCICIFPFHSIQLGGQPHLACSKRLVVCTLCLRLMESDPHIICSLHPHVARSNPFATLKPQPLFEVQRQPWFQDFPVDASMDNYKKRQQQQDGSGFKPPSRVDEGRRTKMKMEREITDSNNKDSSDKISNSTSSSLHKEPQPNGGGGGGSRGQSPRPGFDPQTNGLYETSAKGPSFPPQQGYDPETNYDLYKTSALCHTHIDPGYAQRALLCLGRGESFNSHRPFPSVRVLIIKPRHCIFMVLDEWVEFVNSDELCYLFREHN